MPPTEPAAAAAFWLLLLASRVPTSCLMLSMLLRSSAVWACRGERQADGVGAGKAGLWGRWCRQRQRRWCVAGMCGQLAAQLPNSAGNQNHIGRPSPLLPTWMASATARVASGPSPAAAAAAGVAAAASSSSTPEPFRRRGRGGGRTWPRSCIRGSRRGIGAGLCLVGAGGSRLQVKPSHNNSHRNNCTAGQHCGAPTHPPTEWKASDM